MAARRKQCCLVAIAAKGEAEKESGPLGRPTGAAGALRVSADPERINESASLGVSNQLQSAISADASSVSVRRELAPWRAFLRDEIDAILRDKD
jgi:hypothetical protein